MIATTEEALATASPAPSSPPVLPTERCYGLGEVIYAHRVYMGLNPRAMARKLDFDHRDYQRIESGRNRCPVGFLSKVMELVDRFDQIADAIVDAAVESPTGAEVQVSTDPRYIWERNVAGRAAVLALSHPDRPRVTLTVMGQVQR